MPPNRRLSSGRRFYFGKALVNTIESHTPARRPWLPLAGLALLCVFHLLANLWWLRVDNHVIRGDEESHMEYARAYYEVLALNEYPNVFEKLIALANIRPTTLSHPPLLHLIGGLEMMLFGYGTDVLGLTNSFVFILSLIAVYLLMRRIFTPAESLFVTFVFSATPMVCAGSRFFMTDYLSMGIVLWSCYALLQSNGFRATGWVLFFAILNGLAMMTRTVNFLYVLAPAALVFSLGTLQACREASASPRDWSGVRALITHALLTIIVTLGLSLPWYFRHVETVYDFWVTYRVSITGTPVAGLDEVRVPEKEAPAPPLAAPAPEADNSQAPKAAPAPSPPAKPEPSTLEKLVYRVVYPPSPWVEYPVHIINNVLFLPLTLLALLGLLLAPLHPRLRRFDLLFHAVWLLGTIFLLQMLLRWTNPRYTLQFIPPLSIFAGVALLMIPPGRFRRIALGAATALLVIQYVNLTFLPLPFLGKVSIPVVLSESIQKRFDDPGLAVIKNMVSGSNPYRHMGVPESDNYKDRVFAALVAAETSGPQRAGEFADYARLNMLGMGWEERHYWPEPNPFITRDIPADALPRRKLRSTVLVSDLSKLESFLPAVDYVVYRASTPEEEVRWLEHLAARGFSPIMQYNEPQIGGCPPAWFGVVQKGGGTVLDLSKVESVSNLGVYDLHALINTPTFQYADKQVQKTARARYKELLAQYKPFELTSQISLLNADIVALGNGMFRMRYLLQVTQDIDRDVGMYLIGRVEPHNQGLLPEDARAKGLDYFTWHNTPSPPTGTWKRATYKVITHDFQPQPVPHALMMGFETFSGDLVGRGVELGVTDFGAVK